MSVLTQQGIAVVTGPGTEVLTVRVDKELTQDDVTPTIAAIKDAARSTTSHVQASLENHEPIGHCELAALRTQTTTLGRAGLTFDVRTSSTTGRRLLGLAGIPAYRVARGCARIANYKRRTRHRA